MRSEKLAPGGGNRSINPSGNHASVLVDDVATVNNATPNRLHRQDTATSHHSRPTKIRDDAHLRGHFHGSESENGWAPPHSFGLKAALIASDLILIAIASAASFSNFDSTADSFAQASGQAPSSGSLIGLSVGAVLIFILAFAQQNLYNSRHVSRRAEELRRLVNATALGSICVAAGALAIDVDPPFTWFFSMTILSLVMTALGREVLRRFINHQRAVGKISRRVILVGSNEEAEELHEMLSDSSELGYDVVGRVSDTIQLTDGNAIVGEQSHTDGTPAIKGNHAPWLGTTDNILQIVRERNASGVVVATTDIDLETANRLVRTLTNEGIYVEMSSAMRDIATRRVTIRPLGRYPVMTVEPVENNGWRAGFKRCFDIILSLLILLG
ncbi:MAG: hypothetical protein KDB26_05825, partial [Microthrixaceae bacterium]|nr:hypothetical protein [Microthrixaceae bacterium]